MAPLGMGALGMPNPYGAAGMDGPAMMMAPYGSYGAGYSQQAAQYASFQQQGMLDVHGQPPGGGGWCSPDGSGAPSSEYGDYGAHRGVEMGAAPGGYGGQCGGCGYGGQCGAAMSSCGCAPQCGVPGCGQCGGMCVGMGAGGSYAGGGDSSFAVPGGHSMGMLERQMSSTTLSDQSDSPGSVQGWERLYVTNLPREFTEADVQHLFAHYGALAEVSAQRRGDGTPKNSSFFVTFASASDGHKAAKSLNNCTMPGTPRPLTVRPSTSRRRADAGAPRAAAMGGGGAYRAPAVGNGNGEYAIKPSLPPELPITAPEQMAPEGGVAPGSENVPPTSS